MNGKVVKALRIEAQYQDRPLKDLKRQWQKLDHRARGGWRAKLAVYRAMRERFWTTEA